MPATAKIAGSVKEEMEAKLTKAKRFLKGLKNLGVRRPNQIYIKNQDLSPEQEPRLITRTTTTYMNIGIQ